MERVQKRAYLNRSYFQLRSVVFYTYWDIALRGYYRHQMTNVSHWPICVFPPLFVQNRSRFTSTIGTIPRLLEGGQRKQGAQQTKYHAPSGASHARYHAGRRVATQPIQRSVETSSLASLPYRALRWALYQGRSLAHHPARPAP